MRAGGKLPGDRGELVLTDSFLEQVAELSRADALEVMATVVRTLENPGGKHPLSARVSRALVGCNTVETLGGTHRIVYFVDENQASITVFALGLRRNNEIYDKAIALVNSGVLTADEITSIWQVLALLDIVAETFGLDSSDYLPQQAPEGLVLAAVRAGILDEDIAQLLSKEEINEAMIAGFANGEVDMDAALTAALKVARGRSGFDSADIIRTRKEPRCANWMPRSRALCIRRAGHSGPCRSVP